MKTLKRIFAMTLAIMMVMGLSVAAFATTITQGTEVYCGYPYHEHDNACYTEHIHTLTDFNNWIVENGRDPISNVEKSSEFDRIENELFVSASNAYNGNIQINSPFIAGLCTDDDDDGRCDTQALDCDKHVHTEECLVPPTSGGDDDPGDTPADPVKSTGIDSDGESYVTGSITIKNPQENETYNAYKIFDVTYRELEGGTNDTKYAYTINPEWVADVQAYVGNTVGADGVYPAITAKGLTITPTPVKDTDGLVVYNVVRVVDNPDTTDANEDIFSAADFAEEMAKKTATNKTAILFEDGVADDLDLGYYLVEPTNGALVSLTTTDKDVTVSDKNETPVVDKKLVGEERVLICKKEVHTHTDACKTDGEVDTAKCTKEEHAHSEENGCYAEKDYTTKSVGDKVEFELDTKVPDMTGYDPYFFVMNDTMTAGLTFNDDVKITLDGTELTPAATYYTVKTEAKDDGTTEIRIVFKNMKQWWNDDEALDKAGKPIVITYSATVDEDAVMGTDGNTNTAKIEYSNNPNIVPNYDDPDTEGDDPDPDPEHPDPDFDPDDPLDPKYKHNQTTETTDDPTGVSNEDKVTVYTSELDITKVDANGGAALTGAKFKIEGEKLNVSIVNSFIFKEDNANGTWYRLKDGTYTEEAPVDMTVEGASTADTYEAVTVTPVEFEELTGDAAVPGAGLYYSTDDGVTKTLITDGDAAASVPDGAKIYQPTYNTPGLFVKGEGDIYTEVTEENAAEFAKDSTIIYNKKIVHKQSDLYEDTTKKYVKVEVIDKTNTGAGKYTAEGFVGENGVITFGGLAEGTYKITELVAPDGYNLLKAPIEVIVKLVQDTNDTTGKTYKFQATIDDAENAVSEADGHISFNVENNSGTELPETGGIGTTIFYVVGGLLLAGAGVLLITRKRMSEEEN